MSAALTILAGPFFGLVIIGGLKVARAIAIHREH